MTSAATDITMEHAGAAGGGETRPPAPVSVRDRAIRGAAWTLGGFGAGQAIRLAANVVLARMLMREDFGLMGVVAVTLQAVNMVTDLGTWYSLVRNPKGRDPEFVQTAWTIDMIRSVALACIVGLLAYPVSRYYHEPMLLGLLLAASASTLLSGLTSPALVLTARDLRTREATKIELVSAVLSSAVMVVLAWQYKSVWALLAGTLVSTIVRVWGSHALLEKLPLRLRLHPEHRRELLRASRWIFVSTIMTFVGSQADRLVVSKLLNNMGMFGLYNIAVSYVMLPLEILQRIVSSVLFPAFTSMTRHGKMTGNAYKRAASAVQTVGGVLLAGLVATVPPFLQAVYKPEFHDAGVILVFLAGVAWVRTVQHGVNTAHLAADDTKTPARANMWKIAAMVLLLPGAMLWAAPALLPWAGRYSPGVDPALVSVLCAAVAMCVAEVVKYAVMAVALARRSGVEPLVVDLEATVFFVAVCTVLVVAERAMFVRGVSPVAVFVTLGVGVVVAYTGQLWSLAQYAHGSIPRRIARFIPRRDPA